MQEFLYEAMDRELIERTLKALPGNEEIEALAEFYKVMGDPTRLQLLMALENGEFCVSDLCNVLNMNRSAVSHQLKALKTAKLSKSRKDGKTVYYSLDDEHVRSVLEVALEHIRE